jgi:hypothetical protein
MLKNIILACSISLLAVACGGGAEEAKGADDMKKDAPAGDAAKPADGAAAPAGDAAKPADPAAKPADAAAAPK